MKIRRYLASNTQEAILKVKMDLGSEAIILNTKKVRQKGLFRMFAKPMVEVLAAVDEVYGSKKANEPVKNVEVPQVAAKEEEKISQLENKVTSMESMLQKIYNQIQTTTQKPFNTQQDVEKDEYPKVLQMFYNNLLKNEVEVEIAKKIMDCVIDKVGMNGSVNDIASIMYNIISGMLGEPQTLKLREDGKPTIVLLIGPTGVGKTTTLAKIAANYSLNHSKKVGLITADTYRIAAVEQLKTYAEILGMPVSVIYSVNEVTEAISKYNDKDIILIDTAGRSHKNKTQFDELKTLVNACQADEIYLLLSTTISVKGCRELVKNYSYLKNYKLIFTKLDETPITGIILNARYLTNRSLSYITTGQSVPDDIEVVNIDRIAKNLLGSIT